MGSFIAMPILLEAAETDFTSYINTMAEVMAWVDRIGSPAFAPMLDTHQLYGAERSIESGIRAARGRAQHIHLFEPSRYPPGVLVNKPVLDWPQIARILREEGLPTSASVVIASDGDPEPVARTSVAYLRRLFAAVAHPEIGVHDAATNRTCEPSAGTGVPDTNGAPSSVTASCSRSA